jgi:iron complex transport system substrate-binding protein
MHYLIVVIALACSCGSKRDPAASSAPRIVSLTPSATEVVAALGATSQLVGVDEFSKYPPEVEKLPKVGSFLSPNLEVIVKLEPTLVIVDDIHGQVASALKDHGIASVECDMHALPDVKHALRTVGDKLGRSKEADAAIESIDRALDEAAAKRPARHPRVLAIIDREAGGLGGLIAAGPGSWVDELIAVSGGDNVLAASGVRYPKISLEEVLRGDPEIILDVSYSAEREIAAWNRVDVSAVKNGKVRMLKEPYFRGPSPRVKQALDGLAEALK